MRSLLLAALLALSMPLAQGHPFRPADQAVPFCPNNTDCGWIPATVPANVTTTEASLWSVVWASPTTLVAVGNLGTILRSTDFGQSWSYVRDPLPSVDLHTVARAPGGMLWAGGIGGALLESADTGVTWSTAPDGGLTGNITRIAFPSPSDPWFAYAATSTGTFVSRDGGTSWSMLTTPVGGTVEVAAFSDPLHGWIEGYTTTTQVFYTTDGGVHWAAGSVPGGFTAGSGMVALGPTDAWVLGVQDAFYATTDGTNWTMTGLASAQRSHALTSAGGGVGWAGAEDANLFYTSDGGTCWTEEGVPQIPEIYAIAFENSTWGVLVGDGIAWYTTSAGLSSYDAPGNANPTSACGTGPSAQGPVEVLAGGALIGLVGATVLLMGPRRKGPRRSTTPDVARGQAHLRQRTRYRSRRRYVGSH